MIDAATWFRRRWMTPPNMLFVWHLGLTAMLAWWAFILAWPEPTFAISRSYDRYVDICPDERFWACGYGFAALVGALGCYAAWPKGGRLHERRRCDARFLSAFVLGTVHGITAILMFNGARMGTGSGIYVLIMCSGYLLMRAEYERS